MGGQEQYRIVEVDSPLYGSHYVVQYAHRTLFLNRLVWKDLFDSRDSRAGDGMFFSFIAAKGALERHKVTRAVEKGTVIQTLHQNTKILVMAETLTFNEAIVELKHRASYPHFN